MGRQVPLLTPIKGWFSRNIVLKIISLLLGLFLWLHAVTDQSHQMDYSIPLELSLSDTSLIIVNKPPSIVNVIFAGTGKELLKLWWKHPVCVKEIEDGEAGVLNLNLDVSSLSMPTGLHLIPLGIKSPATLHVVLDKRISKEVRVVSRLKVIPAEGHVLVGEVKVHPETVVLTGARGELKDIAKVQTIESVEEGVTDSFTTTLPIDLSGLNTVTSGTQEVTLTGKVEKYVEIEVGEIPVGLKGRLKEKFVLQPKSIELVLIGPVSLMQELKKEELKVYIEINDPPIGETYYSPTIRLPDGIKLLSEQPKLFKAIPVDEAGNETPEDVTFYRGPNSARP